MLHKTVSEWDGAIFINQMSSGMAFPVGQKCLRSRTILLLSTLGLFNCAQFLFQPQRCAADVPVLARTNICLLWRKLFDISFEV